MSDAGKHPNPTSHPFSKFRSKVDHLASDLGRLGTAVSTTFNPNHRHDEAWEKERDAKIEAIRDAHRYRSFAGPRDYNVVKHHIDGHGERYGTVSIGGGLSRTDYFWALSEVIDSAKEVCYRSSLLISADWVKCIMILDWWLSPELQVSSQCLLWTDHITTYSPN